MAGVQNTLVGCLPQLVDAYNCLAQAAAGFGIGVAINDYGGFRTAATTAEIMAYRTRDYAAALASGEIPASVSVDQFRPIAEYGASFHDYGAAVDVSPVSWPSGLSESDAAASLGVLAGGCGLRQPLPVSDPAHLELDLSLSDAAALYASYAGAGGASPVGGAWGWLLLLALGGVALVLLTPDLRGARRASLD